VVLIVYLILISVKIVTKNGDVAAFILNNLDSVKALSRAEELSVEASIDPLQISDFMSEALNDFTTVYIQFKVSIDNILYRVAQRKCAKKIWW